MPRGSGTHPLWGVEQVYASRDFKKRVIVKKNVKLSRKAAIGGWVRAGKGFVFHKKRGKRYTAVYAEGLSARERAKVQGQFTKKEGGEKRKSIPL